MFAEADQSNMNMCIVMPINNLSNACTHMHLQKKWFGGLPCMMLVEGVCNLGTAVVLPHKCVSSHHAACIV